METGTWLIVLLVVNIPVYIFIGWLVFDSPGKAVDSLADYFVEILKTVFLGVSGDTFNLFPLFAFVVGCIAAIGGEFYLLYTYGFVK